MSTTWTDYEMVTPLSEPTWTISTLMALYLAYPTILSTLSTWTSPMLVSITMIMFHVQCLPYILAVHIALNGRLEIFPNEVLEMHLAPFLDKLSVFEQKIAGRSL